MEEKSDAQNEAKQAKARLNDLAPKLNKMETLAEKYSDDPQKEQYIFADTCHFCKNEHILRHCSLINHI